MRHVAAVLLAGTLVIAGCASAPGPSSSTGPQGSTATARAGAPEIPGRGPASAGPPPAVSLAPPAGPAAEADYRLAPKDQLSVHVHGQDDLTRTLRVSEGGTITLPLLGEMKVAGLSAKELEQKIEAGLKGRYLVNPRVNVSVVEFQGRQITVMGAVNQPGPVSLKSNHTTLLGAISEAKGVRDNADRVAYVLRARPRPGEAQPVSVDLDALLRNGNPGYNIVIEPGDSVYVPEANTFYVAGEVEKRGAFTLRRDTTVSKAITEAGGVTKRAAKGELKIVRTLPNGDKQEIKGINLDAVMSGDRSKDIPLQAQDVIVVPTSGAKVAAYGILDFLKAVFAIGIP